MRVSAGCRCHQRTMVSLTGLPGSLGMGPGPMSANQNRTSPLGSISKNHQQDLENSVAGLPGGASELVVEALGGYLGALGGVLGVLGVVLGGLGVILGGLFFFARSD